MGEKGHRDARHSIDLGEVGPTNQVKKSKIGVLPNGPDAKI
jgi:hypothetical protein